MSPKEKEEAKGLLREIDLDKLERITFKLMSRKEKQELVKTLRELPSKLVHHQLRMVKKIFEELDKNKTFQ